MKLAQIVISSVVSTLILFGCSNTNEGVERVSVYVSADEQIAREVFAAFTDQTGIHVDWVGDSESSKNTTLVQRLIREKENPVADVFWSSEILGTILLSRQNMFAVCNAPNAMNWPENHRDSKFHWFGFSPRARVIAYDPKIMSKEDFVDHFEITIATIAILISVSYMVF